MSIIEGFEAVLRIVWDILVFRGTTNDAYTPRHGQENSTRSTASHGSRAGSHGTHKHTPHSAPARLRSTGPYAVVHRRCAQPPSYPKGSPCIARPAPGAPSSQSAAAAQKGIATQRLEPPWRCHALEDA